MKRCPNCNDMAIYDDTVMTCPICDAGLVRISTGDGSHAPSSAPESKRRTISSSPSGASSQGCDRRQGSSSGAAEPPRQRQSNQEPSSGRRVVRPVSPLGGSDAGTTAPPIVEPDSPDWNRRANSRRTTTSGEGHTSNIPHAPQFETQQGRITIFRGIVVEVNSHSRYYNRFHKIINTVFRREPYQFGHSSYESIIRVEEFTDNRLPSRWQDLIMYGDIEGRVQVGDDVEIRAIRRHGQYIIQNLHSNQTNSDVTPGPQLSVLLCAILVILVCCLFASLLYGIYAFFTKGGFEALIMAVVNLVLAIIMKLLPLIALIIVGFMILSLFTGIGRKR